jgi:hypothetical protein
LLILLFWSIQKSCVLLPTASAAPESLWQQPALAAGRVHARVVRQEHGAPASNAEIEQDYETVKFSGTALASLAQKEAITRLRITDQALAAQLGEGVFWPPLE